MRDDTFQTEVILCDCFSHALSVSYDKECEVFFIGFLEKPHRSNLWWRIANAWKVLTGSKEYGEDIILDHTKAQKLSDFIGRCLWVTKK